jgi:hypothetical protein
MDERTEWGGRLTSERNGQHELSQASLKRFLELWKDADADIPEKQKAVALLAGSI